jgi:hypothetical protein
MGMADDLLALIQQFRDREPAWLTQPRGELQISPWLSDDGMAYVVASEFSDGPMVLLSETAHKKLKQVAPTLTDQQLASWFVYRAEGERWNERGMSVHPLGERP